MENAQIEKNKGTPGAVERPDPCDRLGVRVLEREGKGGEGREDGTGEEEGWKGGKVRRDEGKAVE